MLRPGKSASPRMPLLADAGVVLPDAPPGKGGSNCCSAGADAAPGKGGSKGAPDFAAWVGDAGLGSGAQGSAAVLMVAADRFAGLSGFAGGCAAATAGLAPRSLAGLAAGSLFCGTRTVRMGKGFGSSAAGG